MACFVDAAQLPGYFSEKEWSYRSYKEGEYFSWLLFVSWGPCPNSLAVLGSPDVLRGTPILPRKGMSPAVPPSVLDWGSGNIQLGVLHLLGGWGT